jgi:hypothetical protein
MVNTADRAPPARLFPSQIQADFTSLRAASRGKFEHQSFDSAQTPVSP